MPKQSENTLETNLIKQLESLNYKPVVIEDESQLLDNLKMQIGIHNEITLSDAEFARVLNHLKQSNPFDCSTILRDKFNLERDDGQKIYIEFLNKDKWCQNEYQVTRQISIDGKYKNRYDVTLLVNGLPLVQIELKRSGQELKEAFHQINRYHRHSYGAGEGLFLYIQLFVISNGVNTKYYTNNKPGSGQTKMGFEQTFYWTDKDNNRISGLNEFTNSFLEPCHLSKMITKYIVLNQTKRLLMVLRPYQFYAVENIVDRVKNTNKNGYIWHTTGSGKTLTSFKASQILAATKSVHKVIFVVDRKDLDSQTTEEFNLFAKDSVDPTDNTAGLVKQLNDDSIGLIVTTIQKLSNAITLRRHQDKVADLKDKRVVFIFDECHRSQFGDTHKRIKEFFSHAQMFGFTGTPIFAENASKNDLGKRTTKDLFEECLHKYVITDAIRDESVLKFSIEYVGKYKQRETSRNNLDIDVESIDTKELMESPLRINKIVDYIIANHDRKTHSRKFTAMLCVGSIDAVTQYYEAFRARDHKLKIATIFSYGTNEDDSQATSNFDEAEIIPAKEEVINIHSRDKLEGYIEDYNKMFGSKFSTKDSDSFRNYNDDISKRVKTKEIDLLIVVNMFLTGFDSKSLNTLYVDKKLQYHGLVQAFSRTNRIYNPNKSQGNIVCFRNLKHNTDEAIALFSNKDAHEVILTGPYEDYQHKFEVALEQLYAVTPTVASVDTLPDEQRQLLFVKAFRELLRVKNVLSSFSDFDYATLGISEQTFVDYTSKYLDLRDKVRPGGGSEKVSILDDVDFELELIQRDDITVSYILNLLGNIVRASESEKEIQIKKALDTIASNPSLRSKRELIEKFIGDSLPQIQDAGSVQEQFENFVELQKNREFVKFCEDEKLDKNKFDEIVGKYVFNKRLPLPSQITDSLLFEVKILDRRTIINRIKLRLEKFVETYLTGV